MVTYDFDQVKEYAESVSASLSECEQGDALYCGNLDNTLSCAAEKYFKFAKEVRQWAHDVFSGKVMFDPAAEKLWRAETQNFYQRAARLLSNGAAAVDEHGCGVLDGANKLRLALWNMAQLLNYWVKPSLAVGPSARQPFTADADRIEAARRKLGSLPPLPSDWKPYDKRQAAMLNRPKG